MKQISPALLFAATIFSVSAFAQSFSSVDAISFLRNSSGLKSSRCQNCETVETKAVEFSNGNTDVQIKSSVAGKSVAVLVNEILTPNDLIELLLQVRALRDNGAHKISVEVARGSSEKLRVLDSQGKEIQLSIDVLLSSAGADQLVDRTELKDIKDLSLEKKLALSRQQKNQTTVPPEKTMVDSIGHEGLAKDLSEKMGLRLLDQSSLLMGRGVILVGTQLNPINENYLKTLSRAEFLRERGAQVHLVLGYLPYARSDKTDRAGITTGAALMADLLQTTGIRGISYVRAHAPQSSGFYSGLRSRETLSFESLKKAFNDGDIDLVVSPDAGAQKEATKVADLFGVSVAVINKQRDGNKTVIRGISLPENLKSLGGLKVLIVDDETASGSTLKEAAEYLKSLNASKVYAAVTHLAGQPKAAIESEALDRLLVTDTIPVQVQSEKLVVVSIAEELARDVSHLLWPAKQCVLRLGSQ